MQPLHDADPRQIGVHRVLARLGGGARALVYLGEDPYGRQSAIKVVQPQLAAEPAFRPWFVATVQTARAIADPCVAPVTDADLMGHQLWFATPYDPSPSLETALEIALARGEPLSEYAMFVLVCGIAQALAACHAAGLPRVAPRPADLLLTPTGPRLVDLGIARNDESALPPRSASVALPAPEDLRGEPAGPPADVYLLGALVVLAASGEGPYGIAPPWELHHRMRTAPPYLEAVPPSLRHLVGACLDHMPARRPTAAQILATVLPPGRTLADMAQQGWLPPAIVAATAAPVAAPAAPPRPAGPPSTPPSMPSPAGGSVPPSGGHSHGPGSGSVPVSGSAQAITPPVIRPPEERDEAPPAATADRAPSGADTGTGTDTGRAAGPDTGADTGARAGRNPAAGTDAGAGTDTGPGADTGTRNQEPAATGPEPAREPAPARKAPPAREPAAHTPADPDPADPDPDPDPDDAPSPGAPPFEGPTMVLPLDVDGHPDLYPDADEDAPRDSGASWRPIRTGAHAEVPAPGRPREERSPVPDFAFEPVRQTGAPTAGEDHRPDDASENSRTADARSANGGRNGDRNRADAGELPPRGEDFASEAVTRVLPPTEPEYADEDGPEVTSLLRTRPGTPQGRPDTGPHGGPDGGTDDGAGDRVDGRADGPADDWADADEADDEGWGVPSVVRRTPDPDRDSDRDRDRDRDWAREREDTPDWFGDDGRTSRLRIPVVEVPAPGDDTPGGPEGTPPTGTAAARPGDDQPGTNDKTDEANKADEDTPDRTAYADNGETFRLRLPVLDVPVPGDDTPSAATERRDGDEYGETPAVAGTETGKIGEPGEAGSEAGAAELTSVLRVVPSSPTGTTAGDATRDDATSSGNDDATDHRSRDGEDADYWGDDDWGVTGLHSAPAGPARDADTHPKSTNGAHTDEPSASGTPSVGHEDAPPAGRHPADATGEPGDPAGAVEPTEPGEPVEPGGRGESDGGGNPANTDDDIDAWADQLLRRLAAARAESTGRDGEFDTSRTDGTAGTDDVPGPVAPSGTHDAPGRTVPGRTVPEQGVPEQGVPEQRVPKQRAADHAPVAEPPGVADETPADRPPGDATPDSGTTDAALPGTTGAALPGTTGADHDATGADHGTADDDPTEATGLTAAEATAEPTTEPTAEPVDEAPTDAAAHATIDATADTEATGGVGNGNGDDGGVGNSNGNGNGDDGGVGSSNGDAAVRPAPSRPSGRRLLAWAAGAGVPPVGAEPPPERATAPFALELRVRPGTLRPAHVLDLTAQFRVREPMGMLDTRTPGCDGLFEATGGPDGPDVFELDLLDVARYVAAGRLADLTPYQERLDVDRCAPGLAGACTVDGRLVALPLSVSVPVVRYDRALYQAAGVPEPRTMDDWLDGLDRLREAHAGRPGFRALAVPDALSWSVLAACVFDQGGEIAVADGGGRRGALDRPEAVRGLEVFGRLMARVPAGAARTGGASRTDAAPGAAAGPHARDHHGDTADDGVRGPVASVITGASATDEPAGAGEEFGPGLPQGAGAFPLPGRAEGRPATVGLRGSVLAVSARCRKVAAAVEVLALLSGDAWRSRMARDGRSGPVRPDLAARLAVGDPVLGAALRALAGGSRAFPAVPGWTSAPLAELAGRAAAGGTTGEAAKVAAAEASEAVTRLFTAQ